MDIYFYHKLTRKYQLLLGNIFSNFFVTREEEPYLVPSSFAPKDKLIQRYLRRDESMKGVAMTLPRMAIEFRNMKYDAERKLNRLNKIIISENADDRSIVYTPVPYNIDVKVSVITNRTDDACEIGEQIIPLFTHDIKIAAKNLLENSDHVFDLSLNLDFINTNDNYEGELTKRRLITWEFNFTFKTWFFKDIQSENFIKEATANFYVDSISSNNFIDFVTVTTDDL